MMLFMAITLRSGTAVLVASSGEMARQPEPSAGHPVNTAIYTAARAFGRSLTLASCEQDERSLDQQHQACKVAHSTVLHCGLSDIACAVWPKIRIRGGGPPNGNHRRGDSADQ